MKKIKNLLLGIGGFFILLLALNALSVKNVKAFIDPWGAWEDTSICSTEICGTNIGTKNQQRVRSEEVCDKDCPTFTFSASHQIVDIEEHYIYSNKIIDEEGYYSCSGHWTLDGNQCKKWHEGYWWFGWHDGYWEYKDATYHNPTYKCPDGYQNNPGHSNCRKKIATTYKTETFGPIDVKYDKSEDPNKCHRPTGVSQGVPAWAESDYNTTLKEWEDSTDINCRQEVVETQTQTIECNEAPILTCPLNCRDDQVEIDGECECPSDKVEFERSCVVDECLEVEGVQLNKDLCPDITPTPTESITLTPTPTETPKQEVRSDSSSSGTSMPTAPVCNDGNTINLPANPHVYRKGEEAIVNWFETEGNSANIYYKEVGQENWTHAVRDIEVNNADRFGSVTIRALNPNLGYIFGIQQKYGCGGGETVIAVIVDGPESQLFQFSYWIWAK